MRIKKKKGELNILTQKKKSILFLITWYTILLIKIITDNI